MRSVRDIFKSYGVLDKNGRHVNGTDKESNHHYGDAYERIINNNFSRGPVSPRQCVSLMMEVGIADGSSLLAWSEIFPNATCVGLDVHSACKLGPWNYPRVEFYLGDQRSNGDCRRAAAGRAFDVIVEDATHVLENSLLTLFYLWPFIRPGGLYIIEEFANIGALQYNVHSLWPNAEIVDTIGPSGGREPLVVLRKPI